MTLTIEEQASQFRQRLETLRNEIGKVIVGHDDVVKHTLVAIIAGGAVLRGSIQIRSAHGLRAGDQGVVAGGKTARTFVGKTVCRCSYVPAAEVEQWILERIGERLLGGRLFRFEDREELTNSGP